MKLVLLPPEEAAPSVDSFTNHFLYVPLIESFCYLPVHILKSPPLRSASYPLPEISPKILKPKGCFLGTGDLFYN